MVNSSVLVQYEDLARLTDDMLACAKEERWEDLVKLEQERALIVDVLRQSVGLAQQPTHIAQQCEMLISKILTQQAEISQLVGDWRAELGDVLRSFETGRKLSRTYSGM